MVNATKDIVFAVRTLARNPGFTFVAVATLALGIGVSSAIFSVFEGVLIKPLPYPSSDRLAMVWHKSRSGTQLGVSELDLDDYRARSRAFEALGGFTPPGTKSAILTGNGSPTEISPSYVTQNYFPVLGISPIIGRNFLPEESVRGRNNFAILGFSFWQSRFGGSRDVLNRQITLNRQKLHVVGVVGQDVYPVDADVFLPFTRISPEKPLPRNYPELNIVGRLRPGQTLAAAQREMDALTAELEHSYPATNAGIGAFVLPLHEEITGKVRAPVTLLMAAVLLVLVIACGNLTNLLLVRATSRQKETAIRVALGAGPGRIAAQFAVECLILSAAGAGLGLLLAFTVMPLIRFLGGQRIPRLQHVGVDSGVLLYVAGIALLAGLLLGMVPAFRAASTNLAQAMRAGGQTSQSDSGLLRNVLVGSEVALALVVIVVAGLLLRSLNRLLEVQPGFRKENLLIARIALPPNQYGHADVQKFFARLLPKIAGTAGVASVSTTTAVPLASPVTPTRFAVQGAPLPEPGHYPVAAIASVDGQFFQTMGIPIQRGRTFRPEEVGNIEQEHCIINDTLARTYFNGQNPLGRVILSNVAAPQPEPCEIVGVVGDTRLASLDAPPGPMLYFASYVAKGLLVVHTTIDPLAVAPAIQRALAAADPEQPLSGIQSMDQVILQSISRRSFAAVLLVIFAALGLTLASLGIYGVLSYSVTQRTREIGVRMALGADQSSVLRLIVGRGLRVTAIGLAAGVIAAAGATRMMSSLVFGIGAGDLLTFVAGCFILLAVATVACLIPARRATKVDPLTALRIE